MSLKPEEFTDRDIQKLVKKIGQYTAKNKREKVLGLIDDLIGFLKSSDGNRVKEAVYILGFLVEEYPEILDNKKLRKILPDLLESESDTVRLNAVILFGHQILKDIEEGAENIGEDFDRFIDFLSDPTPEIRQNVLYMLEDVPPEYYDYMLAKNQVLFDLLEEFDDPELLEIIIRIIGYIWDKTLSIKLDFFNKLMQLAIKNAGKEKSKPILEFLASGYFELKKFLEKHPRPKADELKRFMESRGPMVKIYDLDAIAEEEDMKVRDVRARFEETSRDKNIFGFFYKDKKNYYVEIELKPLVRLLSDTKRKIDELLKIFGDAELDTISLLNLLIKKLVKAKIIKGYLSKNYFYPYSYIKEMLLNDIKKQGKVDLDHYSKFINYEFILRIAEELNKESKFRGIFTKDKALFLTLSSVMKNIERYCIKESIFDLTPYRELYLPEDFKIIEQECKKHFLTKYHYGDLWLTNVGYTRLTRKLRDGQIVGFINVSKIADELEVPIEIVRDIVKDYLEAKPGLWDKSGNVFYFTKYIKQRLGKLDKSASDEEKRRAVEEIAADLNLEPEDIMKKLDQEVEEIIRQLKNKPSIDIDLYCRILGFKREQFIKFVNNLGIEYIVLGREMVFDKKRIEKLRKDVEEFIERARKRDKELYLPALTRRLKFSENMIADIINKFVAEGKIKGFFLTDELFITDIGIRDRLKKNRELITMETVFPERELNEEEQKLVIEILEELIDSGELIGTYNEETHEFRSEEEMKAVDYDAKLDAETLLKIYIRYFQDTYDKIKEIYMNKKIIRPGDAKRKDYLIKRLVKEWGAWEHNLLKYIEKSNQTFESLEDIGDLTFEDILEAENKSEEVDADAIMNEFYKWKQIITDIEQTVDRIAEIKERLAESPNDPELKKELEEAYERAHFFEDL